MSSDTLTGSAVILAGAGLVGLGLYAYAGKGAPALFRRALSNSFGLFGRAVVVFVLPAGLGFTMIGIAFAIGKSSFASDLLLVGLGFVLLAWLVFFIHPSFIQPRWLRQDRRPADLGAKQRRRRKHPG